MSTNNPRGLSREQVSAACGHAEIAAGAASHTADTFTTIMSRRNAAARQEGI